MSRADHNLRVPFTLRDDFETGEMDGWEAYPYAQDVGYEPFTVTRQEPARGRYCLAQAHRSHDTVELRQGFTKEIDLWTAADTRLQLALFLVTDRRPKCVLLSLCLVDGDRYFHTVPSPEANQWIDFDIPVRDFTAGDQRLGAGQHVQAVTIEVSYATTSHLLSYTICLDDFALSGERPCRFVSRDIAASTFPLCDHSVLHRHFHYGDAFNLEVVPEDLPAGPPASVSCTLLDPAGQVRAADLELTQRDGAWTLDCGYAFDEADPRGQWTASLIGRCDDGHHIAWDFRFLMPGEHLTPARHPRLFFSGEELATRLASQSDREREMVDEFVAGADDFAGVDLDSIEECEEGSAEALTGHQFASVNAEPSWSGPINRLRSIIQSGALRFAFTGDERAGQVARQALLKLCAFERWNHPWQLARGNHTYYPVGYTIGPVGIGYDFLYPLLSEEDKRDILQGLMDKGIAMYYRDMVEMNRMPSSVTNHLAVIVANLAVAATAIYGEDPDNPCLEPYLSGILERMKRFIDRTYYPDGSYGEPIGYENMATRDLVEALHVLERNFGIDYTTTTNLQHLYLYPLRGANDDGQLADFGDVGIHGGWAWSGNPFLWLTYRTGNPWTAHYSQPSLESGNGDFYRWLWYTTGLDTRQRDELTPSCHFPEKGTVFMRSGWSDDATRLTFRCGPNSNHYHVDQGTFFLHAHGELLLSEAGLERQKGFHSYYANLYYPAYDTQAAGHNVLLVDGDPQSQTPADYRTGIAALSTWPRISSSFSGWHFDEVEADLTCVYKGKLETYTRSFLFIKPDMVVLYDRVRSPDGHTYSWVFHAEDHDDGAASISADGTAIRVERPAAHLDMSVLSPAMATIEVNQGVRDESFLQLTSARHVSAADFLAVMSPGPGAPPAEPRMQADHLGAEGWIGSRLMCDERHIWVGFRSGGTASPSLDGCTADAERFAVETDGTGQVTGLFLRGLSLAYGGATFTSDETVSASVGYTETGTDVEVEAAAATELAVALVERPRTVSIDGRPTDQWAFDAASGRLQLPVPQGHSLITTR